MRISPPAPARRLAASYEPEFRGRLTVPPEHAEDPEALAAAAAALPEPAARLLDLLLLVVPVGEPLPERLRPAIERDADALWRALLLLPRATWIEGALLHPRHYAGSCRLNPAVAPLAGGIAVDGPVDAVPSFPPADAWWDAVIVAAALEAAPAALNQDGTLRRDVERRLYGQLGDDVDRWSLALRLGRLVGYLRPTGGRLVGQPEAAPRTLADPTALFPDPAGAAVAALLQRLVRDEWVDLRATVDRLRERARELLHSPREGQYADRPGTPFDDGGWARVEAPLFARVADALHRVGAIDAVRDADGVRLFRRARPRPVHATGFLLTPDNDILVHVGEVSTPDYGRLARLAPYVDGARLHRHRLSREGVSADIAAGHIDPAGFLAGHSRTGLPPSVADSVREWQRSATRITVVTGVDLVEEDDGRLRLARNDAVPTHRVIDYSVPPKGRFLYEQGRLLLIAGLDPLPLRAAVERVARLEHTDHNGRHYRPEHRAHPDPGARVEELRTWFGGDLPGELETLVRAGGEVEPVAVRPARMVVLPPSVAAALRRDPVAGPLLRRALSPTESVVPEEDLRALRERVATLGLTWAE